MSRDKTSVVEPEDLAEGSFVTRWSRLKHDAAADAEVAADKAIKNNSPAEQNNRLDVEQPSSHRILTDEDMPDIESLTPESVYTDFLSPGVSEELRKLALRKLFLSEAFNIRDGLDEYDGDYTQFEKLGDIVTSDMHHQLEKEAQRKAQQLLRDEDPLHDGDDSSDLNVNVNNDDENRGVAINSDETGVQADDIQNLTDDEAGNDTEDVTGREQKAISDK